jgi:hypothetical protein
MIEPKASHPYWPTRLKSSPRTAALKSGPGLLSALKSHNYWIATTRLAAARISCWSGASGGRMPSGSALARTRKAKNIASDPHVVIGTEKADEQLSSKASRKKSKTALLGNNLRKSTTPNTAATSALLESWRVRIPSQAAPRLRGTSMPKTSTTPSSVALSEQCRDPRELLHLNLTLRVS